MEKKGLFILFFHHSLGIIALVAVLFMATSASSEAKTVKPIELSLNLQMPPGHFRYTNALKPWIEKVSERTEGRIKIVPYFSASLSAPNEAYNSTAKGICDMAETMPSAYEPGRFPMLDVVQVGPLGHPIKRPARAIWELYQKTPELRAGFKDVKVLWVAAMQPSGFATRKKPIYTLEDAKGLKMVVSGPVGSRVAKAFGMTPLSIPFTEAYLALQKGVADGLMTPTIETFYSRKFAEMSKYFTVAYIPTLAYIQIMNLETWNALPPDLQKIMDELSGDYFVDLVDKAQLESDTRGRAGAIKDYGTVFIDPSPEQLAEMSTRIGSARASYIEMLEAKGLPSKRYVDEYLRLSEKYEK